jgi:hypothetical protein
MDKTRTWCQRPATLVRAYQQWLSSHNTNFTTPNVATTKTAHGKSKTSKKTSKREKKGKRAEC